MRVHFEAYYSGIGEVMRSAEVTGPMMAEANGIASRANGASGVEGTGLGATVVFSEREKDRRPEAQVRAELTSLSHTDALTVLRKAAGV